jgi:ribose 5-phosphate isomerase RpiB
MTGLQLDIDAIVREVLRRLDEQMSRGQARAGRGKAPAQPRDAGCLQLGQRVVTVATLEGRLGGVRRVVVPAGAVVTPAARDLLRTGNITLVCGGETASDQASGEVVWLGLAASSPASDAAAVAVTAEAANVQTIRDECPVAVTRQLIEQVAENDVEAILLTNEPVAALCAANRHRGVRAAWGVSVAAVSQAVQTVKANLLILDPAAHTVFEMRSMARQFVGSPREFSDRWKKLLE